MTFAIALGAGQILGRRGEQQDAFAYGELMLVDGRHAPLAVLADGMGGHHGGARAANIAVETFLQHCARRDMTSYSDALGSALLAANRAITDEAQSRPELRDMGCTLIAVALDGTVLHFISVGDSVVWRVTATGLQRLNADHSMSPVVDAAVARGEMSEEEAQKHRSALRSALTGRPISLIDARSAELTAGDQVILASDGIFTLTELEIHALAARVPEKTCQQRVEAMLDAVEQDAPSDQDNCTIMLLPMASASRTGVRRQPVPLAALVTLLFGLALAGLAALQLGRGVVWPNFTPPTAVLPAPVTHTPTGDKAATELRKSGPARQGEAYPRGTLSAHQGKPVQRSARPVVKAPVPKSTPAPATKLATPNSGTALRPTPSAQPVAKAAPPPPDDTRPTTEKASTETGAASSGP